MTPYVLERRQVLPGDIRSVFAFFADPRNLEAITPSWLRFRIVSSTDQIVREGTRIAYELRWTVVPMRWESVIAEYREGEMFADQMLRGPYRTWYHRHVFRPCAEGVEMTDRVEYTLPLGVLGRLAHRLVVRRQLEAIFDYREQRIGHALLAHRVSGSRS